MTRRGRARRPVRCCQRPVAGAAAASRAVEAFVGLPSPFAPCFLPLCRARRTLDVPCWSPLRAEHSRLLEGRRRGRKAVGSLQLLQLLPWAGFGKNRSSLSLAESPPPLLVRRPATGFQKLPRTARPDGETVTFLTVPKAWWQLLWACRLPRRSTQSVVGGPLP